MGVFAAYFIEITLLAANQLLDSAVYIKEVLKVVP